MNYKESFIEFMVRSNVLMFGDFTTKSGRKTPYFINTGNYKTGAQIHGLGEYYAKFVDETFPDLNEETDFFYGPAYKGIVLAAAAGSSLYRIASKDIPVTYNRKEAKDHGEGGSIIGYKPKSGSNCYIIEDVITAGTSARETIEVLKPFDVNFKALIISVDRCEKGQNGVSAKTEILNEFSLKTYAIVTIYDVLSYLHNKPIALKKDEEPVIVVDDKMYHAIETYLQMYAEPQDIKG